MIDPGALRRNRTVAAVRNWQACAQTGLEGVARKIVVTGEVQLHDTAERPALREIATTGSSSATLWLSIEVSCPHSGNPFLNWQTVRFEKVIPAADYVCVQISNNGLPLLTVGEDQDLDAATIRPPHAA